MATENSATPVVTAFLLRRGPGSDEVLLVRRSDKVRTYRGAWAGISGYLEAGVTPLEQVYTELREEVGLDASALHLLKTGAPLAVQDPAQQLSWIVYPFLFTLQGEQDLPIDWEATEKRWVKPAELANYETVPMLREALAEIYPPSTTEPQP